MFPHWHSGGHDQVPAARPGECQVPGPGHQTQAGAGLQWSDNTAWPGHTGGPRYCCQGAFFL